MEIHGHMMDIHGNHHYQIWWNYICDNLGWFIWDWQTSPLLVSEIVMENWWTWRWFQTDWDGVRKPAGRATNMEIRLHYLVKSENLRNFEISQLMTYMILSTTLGFGLLSQFPSISPWLDVAEWEIFVKLPWIGSPRGRVQSCRERWKGGPQRKASRGPIGMATTFWSGETTVSTCVIQQDHGVWMFLRYPNYHCWHTHRLYFAEVY